MNLSSTNRSQVWLFFKCLYSLLSDAVFFQASTAFHRIEYCLCACEQAANPQPPSIVSIQSKAELMIDSNIMWNIAKLYCRTAMLLADGWIFEREHAYKIHDCEILSFSLFSNLIAFNFRMVIAVECHKTNQMLSAA